MLALPLDNKFLPNSGYNMDTSGVDNFLNKVGTFFDNQLTGELDYKRQKELQDRANVFTAFESAKARQYNAEQAQLQRDFEERMSNTAYSRSIADMRANGINPYSMLSSASTPSGAVASVGSGRGAPSTAYSSGQGAIHFLGNVVMSAFNFASKVLNNGKVQAVQYFDRNGESNGGYYKYY